ncbi:hypothetical protein EWB00_004819 [Schistosoma japonicum]|uniref:Uncharacterized protein n=1 Tax=Schistosoma japonicum TaxID=6182 RepID=A0A4Z2DUI4_SCHJA|nr:hypothetical protein EWB00_004819 [Schistosoma japonicum]
MSVSTGKNSKTYYQRGLRSKYHIVKKHGRSLNQRKSLVDSSVKTEKHWNQVNFYCKKEARITLPLKPTGYKSSLLVHRKEPQYTAVKGDTIEGYNQTSKDEKPQNQMEISLSLGEDKQSNISRSSDFRHIPTWLQKSLKPIQDCFLGEPPKLTDTFMHNANRDENASLNTFEVVHKSLKNAKDNIPGDLEEIFSKMGLEQWIKEYKNTHSKDVDEKSSNEQDNNRSCSDRITQNLTHSDKNGCVSKKHLKKNSTEENHFRGQLLCSNTIENQTKSYLSDSGKQSKHKETSVSLYDNTSFPLSLSDKIQQKSLDLLSLEVFDQLQGNNSVNPKDPRPINDKASCQLNTNDRLAVPKNNRRKYPSISHYQQNSPKYKKCLNELSILSKPCVIRSNDIKCGRMNKKGCEVGPENRKIYRWLDGNVYLNNFSQPMLTSNKNKKKYTLPQKSDKKYANQRENTEHTGSSLSTVSPPLHPIWDTPEDLRTSSITGFFHL